MNISPNEHRQNGSEQQPVASEENKPKDFYVYTREKQTHSSMTAAAEATKEENGREMIAITTAHDDPNADAILGDGGIYEVGAMDQLLCNVGLAAFKVCDGMAAVVDRGGLLITEFDNIEPPLNGREQPMDL